MDYLVEFNRGIIEIEGRDYPLSYLESVISIHHQLGCGESSRFSRIGPLDRCVGDEIERANTRVARVLLKSVGLTHE